MAESFYGSLQTKITAFMKDISQNYKLIKMDLVIRNITNDKDITLKLDEKNKFTISFADMTDNANQLTPVSGISTSETLSSEIFKSSANSDVTNTETDIDTSKSINTSDIATPNPNTPIKGGFKKNTSNKYSLTSEITSSLNTTVKNVINTQKGGANIFSATSADSPTSMSATSDYKVGGMKSDYSATSMSATSDYKVQGMKSDYSATSMSATSDYKVQGMKSDYSATSMSATSDYKVGGMKSDNSVTSMSATSDYKVQGMKSDYSATSMSATSISATSDYKVGGMNSDYSATSISATSDYKVGGMKSDYSATSDLSMISHKSNKNNSSLSKMDLIRQKIKELESTSDSNVFQKNKVVQSGGANKQKLNKIMQMGINSSSTSSLCE
jgi:hypothetical protein